MKSIRFLALLLCAALLLPLVPVHAAQSGGSFYLTASTAGQTLIEPVAVPYTAGQTIRDALRGSGYAFGGIDTAFITDIEGVAGNFTVYYDGGAYSLDAIASPETVTAVVFSERERGFPALLDAVTELARFRERTDHVQNYPAAQQAYAAALSGLRTADEAGLTTLLATLRSAVAEYEAILNGTKYPVTFTDTAGTAAQLTLTDSYGNVTQVQGLRAEVVAGEYTFSLSDGGANRVDGTLTVAGAVEKQVALPTGDWFGTIRLHNASGASAGAYPGTQDEKTHTAQFRVEDFRTLAYLYAERGVDAPADAALYSCYIGQNGKDYGDGSQPSNRKSWSSYQTALVSLLTAGMTDCEVRLEARSASGTDMRIQSYTLRLHRVPTLASLAVYGEGTRLPLDFDPAGTDYAVTTVSDRLAIKAAPFDTEGYSVTVNGGTSAEVPVGTITVQVAHTNGERTAYTIAATKVDSVEVRITVPAGTDTAVFNAADSEIAPVGSGTYRLIPGERYTWITTKQEFYHAAGSFEAAAGLTVQASEPDTTDRLSALASYSARNPQNGVSYESDVPFSAAQHRYTLTVPDANSTFYLQATPTGGYAVKARYLRQTTNTGTNGTQAEINVTATVDPAKTATACGQSLAASGYSNTVTLRLSRTAGSVEYYQDYTLLLRRRLTLGGLSAAVDGVTLNLLNAKGEAQSFDRDVTEYWTRVDVSARTLDFTASFRSLPTETNPNSGGYLADINGTTYAEAPSAALTLDPEKTAEDVTVTVHHADAASLPATYTLHVQKTEPTIVTFVTEPKDATVFLTNEQSGRRAERATDGSFALTPGDRYTYTVTAKGYAGTTIQHYTAPEQAETVRVTLQKAAENTGLQQLPAQWPSFRADAYNNGVIDARTPVSSENTVLYWATQLGSGYSSDACGCPIIVDDCLYTYGGETIYKLDKRTGEVLARGKMDHKSSFAINSPTYGEGMIFVGLANGCVQAFDAVTLKSLWLYEDPLGGQPNCPITYEDGYLYTGFWNREDGNANFVCLTVTDEDPAKTDESKLASWTYTSRGGFYWAGAYACKDFVLVGTDDGEAGYTTGHARVLSFDPRSGRLLGELTLPQTGDLRSSVTFVPDSEGGLAGTAYFTTKGGYFYGQHVEADGTFTEGSLRALKLANYANDPKNPAMSTCTPTIYNGRAYIGVSGTAQFGAYSGHNITVIDLASMSVAYSVRTQGYPQTSGILTTAYEAENGYVYVYFFDNYTPGKLRILADKPGQTAPVLITQETDESSGKHVTYDTPYVLFTPSGAQAQYAICSPVIDADGTIYFKNDSAYLMAVGSTMDRLEVTAQPEKTVYHAGQTFDPAGMQVTAVWHNGVRTDVTKLVQWSTDPLTLDDNDFQITYSHVLYQDRDGAPGTAYAAPVGLAALDVRKHIYDRVETTPEGHRGTCSYCGQTDEAFQPHEFVWVIDREPTEEETGLKHEECFCGYRRSENTEIPKKEHEHTYVATVVAPTCTEQGYTLHTCPSCGDTYRDAWTDALGHSWDAGRVTIPATEDTDGERTFTCTRCGAERTEVIPKTGETPCDGGANCPGRRFTDMPAAGNWAHAGIDFALKQGLFNGMSATTFEPDGSMTRAMLVTVLWRLDGSRAPAGRNTFTDVPGGQWYTDAVTWAAENGVVNGVGSGKFEPDGRVTREQIATILFRYAAKRYDTSARADLSVFPDAGRVSAYAREALAWANAAGLVNGTDNGHGLILDPQGDATRAQVAAILMRYVKNIVR